MSPQMTLLDAYLSCLLHDIKKVLLNGQGEWSNQHPYLNNLDSQIDTKSVGLHPALTVHSVPERNDFVTRLAALHHNPPLSQPEESHKDGGVSREDLDPVAIYAIQAADRTHKALYFPTEPRHQPNDSSKKRKPPDILVGMRNPCFYPFFGFPVYWQPKDSTEGDQPCVGNTDARWVNSTRRFKQISEKIDQLRDSDAGLTPGGTLGLLETLVSDFPESTYFPVTSLNFHLRLGAALFLLWYRVLNDKEKKIGSSHPIPYELTLALTTITTPPEKLRNRLRDIRNIRKVSHHLREEIHKALRGMYLDDVDLYQFQHPSSNPFLFYSKDALVLLHGGEDLEMERLQDACSRIAKVTECDLGFHSHVLKIPAEIRIRGWQEEGDPRVGQPLSSLDPNDTKPGGEKPAVEVDGKGLVSIGIVSESILSRRHFSLNDEQSCFTCGKPGNFAQQGRNRDRLCPCCSRLRGEYKYCRECGAYTRKATCPHCGEKTSNPPSAMLLTEQYEDRATNRVAYVMIATNCRPEPEAMRAEAEILMAKYRRDRTEFESTQKRSDKNRGNFARSLPETRSTRFCLYEYLQASLDMAKFQGKLEDLLKECLPEREIPERDSAVESYFLYRSPSLTVVLLDERQLGRFWSKLRKELLPQLNISWAAKAVTCNVHFPVWAVLKEFLEKIEFLSPATVGQTEEIREAARAWYCRDDQPVECPDILDMGKQLLVKAEKDRNRVHNEKSGLIVMRGGIRRNFSLASGDSLVEAGSGRWPGHATLSQLGHLSEFATEVCLEEEDTDSALALLALDLDSRTGYDGGKGEVRPELAGKLYAEFKELADSGHLHEAPGFVREVATRLKSSTKQTNKTYTKGGGQSVRKSWGPKDTGSRGDAVPPRKGRPFKVSDGRARRSGGGR